MGFAWSVRGAQPHLEDHLGLDAFGLANDKVLVLFRTADLAFNHLRLERRHWRVNSAQIVAFLQSNVHEMNSRNAVKVVIICDTYDKNSQSYLRA